MGSKGMSNECQVPCLLTFAPFIPLIYLLSKPGVSEAVTGFWGIAQTFSCHNTEWSAYQCSRRLIWEYKLAPSCIPRG